jgi:MoaA/NifB/PqqE/SkfB family radical SAM enzyme
MRLKDAERKKFISMYSKPEEDIVGYEGVESSEETDLDYLRIRKASETFLTTIPEYVRLKEAFNTYNKKISSSIEEFRSAADLIVGLMEKGVKNGLLVDIRRSEVTEVNRTINFDELVKGVWQIKKSVVDGKKIAPKRTEACNRCFFRNACRKVLRDEEPEECNCHINSPQRIQES